MRMSGPFMLRANFLWRPFPEKGPGDVMASSGHRHPFGSPNTPGLEYSENRLTRRIQD